MGERAFGRCNESKKKRPNQSLGWGVRITRVSSRATEREALRCRVQLLHVQIGTTVQLALATRQSLAGRLQRTALAVTVRAHQARGADAVVGKVVVHRLGATLR